MIQPTTTDHAAATGSAAPRSDRPPLVPAPARRHSLSLAVRIRDDNPNHHLWNNRGTWWCHFTIHRPDFTSERIRVSLATRNLPTARRRRDAILRDLARSRSIPPQATEQSEARRPALRRASDSSRPQSAATSA